MSARVLKRKSDEFYSSADAKKLKKCEDPPLHSSNPHPPQTPSSPLHPVTPSQHSSNPHPPHTPPVPATPSQHRCDTAFYSQPCADLAKALLGCILVRPTPTGRSTGIIVETEAYLGGDDKAAHSYGGKRTERNEAMYMPPGTCYVYTIYGMYNCVNISSLGEGAAVLIRAVEPCEGLDEMRRVRKASKNDRGLCSGPGKLCQALGIDKSYNKLDMVSCDSLWVEPRSHDRSEDDVVCTSRVGVEYAGPIWASKPLRFSIHGNKYVSKK